LSNLKHLSPDGLRYRIRVAKAGKEQLEASIPVMERQIADLQAAITEARIKANNQWQIEVWARYWLNEKGG
jgi:hypothetical protein